MKARTPVGNGTEVVVVEFLSLGRFGSKEGATGVDEVGTGEEEVPVDQEVLLLGAGRGGNEGFVGVSEELEDPLGLLVERLHRAEDGRLLVECFAGPGDECRGNAERCAVGVLEDVRRAGDVPDRVTAGLERLSDAAGRKAGAVRFALDELSAAEVGDGASLSVGGEEAVVFFGGQSGEGIEDVGVVCGPVFDGPVLHGGGDDVGGGGVELLAILDGFHQGLEDGLGETVAHLLFGEDVGGEQFLRGRLAEIERSGRVPVVGDRGDGCLPG